MHISQIVFMLNLLNMGSRQIRFVILTLTESVVFTLNAAGLSLYNTNAMCGYFF